jgi:hypothetical protein
MGIMGVGRQDMDEAFIQHPFGPVLSARAERASERPGCDLHPNAVVGEALHHGVVAFDPGQPLWVGQDRNVASNQDLEKELFEPDWSHVVRRLDEYVAGVGKCQKMTRPQSRNKVLNHMVICARHELEGYAMLIERALQLSHGRDDLRAGVVIDARQDVGSARDDVHAVVNECPRHCERDLDVARPVIDARQQVAMQVDHAEAMSQTLSW